MTNHGRRWAIRAVESVIAHRIAFAWGRNALTGPPSGVLDRHEQPWPTA